MDVPKVVWNCDVDLWRIHWTVNIMLYWENWEEEGMQIVPLLLFSNFKPSYVLFYSTEYHHKATTNLPPNLLSTTNGTYSCELQVVKYLWGTKSIEIRCNSCITPPK